MASPDRSVVGVVAFLLVHGAVELVTVYCLIRRIMRLYPWAIGVLAVLSGVQLQAAIARPTVGARVLTALDVVVIALVVREYRRLRSRAAERDRLAAPRLSREAT